MYDKHYVGLDLTGFQDNGIQRPVSRVTLRLDNDNVLTAGDDTGMEIISDCPHATQEMVNALLAQLKGTQYQMFGADDARLDPAAELGDGITAGGIYSVISRLSDDGSGFPGVTAPGEAELEDEYPAGGPMTQEFNRKIARTNSRITKTAEQIRLEVENEVKGLNAAITIELNKITQEVNDVNAGLSSKIEQTASSLTTQISNTEAGLKNEIKVTADGLTEKISATDGRVTTLSTTVDGINVDVNGEDGKFSKLSQNVNGVSIRVGNAEGKITTVETTINGLTVTDSEGTTFISGSKIATNSITASQIDVDTLFLDTLYVKAEDINGKELHYRAVYSIPAQNSLMPTTLHIGNDAPVYAFNEILVYAKNGIRFYGKGANGYMGSLYIDTENRVLFGNKNISDGWSIGELGYPMKEIRTETLFAESPTSGTSGMSITYATIKPNPGFGTNSYCGTEGYPFSYGYFNNLTAKGDASVGKSGSKIGFFGTAPASKQTISTMTATTSTTAADVARKLNDLISALKKYGLV